MKNYLITLDARQDMEEIFDYIANDNPLAAIKLLDTFLKAMDMLGTHPLIGSIKSAITEAPVRFWPAKYNYLIVYKTSNPIEIVRVLSTYRNISALIN